MNKDEFVSELNKLNIDINDYKIQQLDKYCELLIQENKKYNLTAIIDEKDIYLKHFYDSLTITKIIDISNQSLCDMGTGAGFPGLVLKIVFSELNITLIDATKKKCDFLKLVVNELGLKNVNIINSRVEEYARNNRELFDIVTARAVAPLKHLLEYGIPLLKVNGYFIPLKGRVEDELNDIDNYYNALNVKLDDIIEFDLPFEFSKRTIIKFEKLRKTDVKYPRRYNEIKKNKI